MFLFFIDSVVDRIFSFKACVSYTVRCSSFRLVISLADSFGVTQKSEHMFFSRLLVGVSVFRSRWTRRLGMKLVLPGGWCKPICSICVDCVECTVRARNGGSNFLKEARCYTLSLDHACIIIIFFGLFTEFERIIIPLFMMTSCFLNTPTLTQKRTPGTDSQKHLKDTVVSSDGGFGWILYESCNY